jgi:DNA helicase-2/ATP-dependent DNA helicase PcrA
MPTPSETNPAIEASERALASLRHCLITNQSFVLEAGAGAGKTYSLVRVLRDLVEQHRFDFPRANRKIACITFTNVAKDEIEARTDRSPLIHCDTVHGFCWSLIAPFQKQLCEIVPTLAEWTKKLAEEEKTVPPVVEYSFGHRRVDERTLSLGHDDVIPLTVEMLKRQKFRTLFASRYPIILIDEYQDTNAAWVEAIKQHFLGQPASPLFGFFGDHWQKIYEEGCGEIVHPALTVIGKQANFRSVQSIVDCLNRMRPELTQFSEDPQSTGDIKVFHTNLWRATRRTGSHWAGDLPEAMSAQAFDCVRTALIGGGWDFSSKHTKILMLTHRALAREQGYNSLPGIFSFNSSFTKKDNKLIGFLVDNLEPAAECFVEKRFGAMFAALGSKVPLIKSQTDKKLWGSSMTRLLELRESGTVGDVVAHLRTTRRPRLPDAVEQIESELDQIGTLTDGEVPRSLLELQKLHAVPYQEMIALRAYHSGFSPFETNHGVKGAEFENVLVVIGRGWNDYNFSEMLEWSAQPTQIPANKREKYEQNRNLFYVACSRPKKRLALLFTQMLSPVALASVTRWFGADAVNALPQP